MVNVYVVFGSMLGGIFASVLAGSIMINIKLGQILEELKKNNAQT